MSGYFASNASTTRSTSAGKLTWYQTTSPSSLAASSTACQSGVTASATEAGAAWAARAEGTPAAAVTAPARRTPDETRLRMATSLLSAARLSEVPILLRPHGAVRAPPKSRHYSKDTNDAQCLSSHGQGDLVGSAEPEHARRRQPAAVADVEDAAGVGTGRQQPGYRRSAPVEHPG